MVAALKDEQNQGLSGEVVTRWVQEYIDQGRRPIEAAQHVLNDICDSGLTEDALRLLGPGPLCLLWKQNREKPATKPHRAPPEPFVMPAPPTRRVDTERLKESSSLLEGMYQIGGRWVRLGDMDKAICRAAAQQFKAKALEQAHEARYFHALAKDLNGGERVRQRFDDAALLRIWEVAGQGS